MISYKLETNMLKKISWIPGRLSLVDELTNEYCAITEAHLPLFQEISNWSLG